MPINKTTFNPRDYMQLAVEAMKKSISERREDKISPPVGAVIALPDGTIEKAFRGEFSEGDHAEYTLLERKLRSTDLSGSVLFVTLEPCAIDSRKYPKIPCAQRIVNRRIGKVWVGIEDPDPSVNGKGIEFLLKNNIVVDLFDRDLQETIRQDNKNFIQNAEYRTLLVEDQSKQESLPRLEKPILSTTLDDLSVEEINRFIANLGDYRVVYGSDDFYRIFTQFGYLAKIKNKVHPTGFGMLLFGKYPQSIFPNAVIRATLRQVGRKEDVKTFTGSLPKQVKDSIIWFTETIGRQFDRSSAERQAVYDYPEEVIRESIINALAHRSYDIEKASVYIEVSDVSIVIRSPGEPVKPIGIDRIKNLDAPYLSRNPKITYAFEKLNLSENRGLGFKTMRDLPTKHSLPLPTVTFENPYLVFSFSRTYGASARDNRLNELKSVEVKGLDYIRLNSPVTRKEYEAHFNIPPKTAVRHLTRLVELNLIIRVGRGPGTYYEIAK